MRILTGMAPVEPDAAYPVVTIGNFDGVHLGHQALLRTVVERARSHNGTATLMTFDPHPLKVLAPERAPRLIQTLGQRLDSLRAAGVDLLWLVPFTHEVSRISAQDFAAGFLRQKLGAREICVGKHFVFGKDRQGNIAFLRGLGTELGFQVNEVDELRYRRFRISSTRIREFLLAGRVSLAARILGRPPALSGRVVEGAKKGTTLGFPTANLDADNELIPAHGVYITTATCEGRRLRGLTNIGHRPTISPSVNPTARPVIETHLLGFSGDLYGRSMELEFHVRLREERRFPSVQHLVEQINRDRLLALRFFARVDRRQVPEGKP